MRNPPRDTGDSNVRSGDSDPREPGRFETLLATVTAWDATDDPDDPDATPEPPAEQSATRSSHSADPEDPPWSDPLDRVREILDTRDLPRRAPPAAPSTADTRTGSSILGWLVVGGLLCGLLASLLFTGVLAGPIDRPQPATASLNDTLTLDRGEAAYLNRIYRESTNEVAYCGRISTRTGRPQLTLWLAETIRASPHQIAFRTSNCPTHYSDSLLHTHPSGTTTLSPQDIATLRARPETTMCVQAGPITTTPGARAQNIACYTQPPATTTAALTRVPITITDNTPHQQPTAPT